MNVQKGTTADAAVPSGRGHMMAAPRAMGGMMRQHMMGPHIGAKYTSREAGRHPERGPFP